MRRPNLFGRWWTPIPPATFDAILRSCLSPTEHRNVEEIMLRAIEAGILADPDPYQRRGMIDALTHDRRVTGWIVGGDARYRLYLPLDQMDRHGNPVRPQGRPLGRRAA
jgi:hypothetical protein